MKKIGMNAAGIAVCLALAVALGFSALPTNAAGDTCPLKAAAAAGKSGECSASKAAAGTCSSKKGAGLAKGVGAQCSKGATASLAANKEGASGCCKDGAAKQTAAKDGECCKDAAKQVAAKDGACGEGACKDKDIAKLIAGDSRFTTLALAVKAAGMTGEFQCPNAKTVLAPTNEAFQKVPAEQWAAILQDDAKLKALVANHIIKDAALESCALKEAKSAKSSGGCELGVSACPQSGQVSINNAKVVGDALVASNGIVHAIDSVLLPADMQTAKAEAEATVQVAAAK